MLVAKSSDGGKTFGVATVAIGAPPGPQPYYVRSTLGVQARPAGDRVVVSAWGVNVTSGGPADGAGKRSQTIAVSNDAGATWSAPVDASAPGEQTREPSPAVFGADGAIYLAWRNRDNPPNPSNEIVAKSTDGGATWVRNLAGAVTGLGQGPDGGAQQLAIDPSSGALYLVYQEKLPHGDQDIYFQKSTDGAVTWSTPLRVNDDATANKVRQHVPRIAVAPNGRIDVVWLDHRNSYPSPVAPASPGGADVYYASSDDGGRTFSQNRRITDRTINVGMGLIPRVGSYSWYGPALAPLGNDGVFFAWSDTRDGNVDTDTNDIVTATLRLGTDASPSIQELPKAKPADLSIAASQMAYPGGTERINALLTSKLVVVNKNDVASAWAGAVLARDNAAPLLLVDGENLSKDAKAEIGRLHPTGVYVIGDKSSIPDTLVTAITEAGVTTPAPTSVPTTAAPTTTTTPPAGAPTTAATTTTLPTKNQFAASTVIRLEGATAAEIGRAVAGALDARSDADRGRGAPAVAAAVVQPRERGRSCGAGSGRLVALPGVVRHQRRCPHSHGQRHQRSEDRQDLRRGRLRIRQLRSDGETARGDAAGRCRRRSHEHGRRQGGGRPQRAGQRDLRRRSRPTGRRRPRSHGGGPQRRAAPPQPGCEDAGGREAARRARPHLDGRPHRGGAELELDLCALASDHREHSAGCCRYRVARPGRSEAPCAAAHSRSIRTPQPTRWLGHSQRSDPGLSAREQDQFDGVAPVTGGWRVFGADRHGCGRRAYLRHRQGDHCPAGLDALHADGTATVLHQGHERHGEARPRHRDGLARAEREGLAQGHGPCSGRRRWGRSGHGNRRPSRRRSWPGCRGPEHRRCRPRR